MKIHPAAFVSPGAVINSGVEVGPFSVVEPGAVVGQGCKLAGRVTIKSNTVLGRDCTVHEGAVLGGGPQHLTPPTNPGRVIIGERCIIRENATIHRSMYDDGETRVGSDCLLMVGAHVAHDCRVGNRVILTNNVLLGGHVQVGDRAVLGGGAAVHQNCRIGRLAMIGGCARVAQDVPPFVLTDGEQALIVGLNKIGLRRAGVTSEQVIELKAAYRLIYRQGLGFEEMIAALDEHFPTGLPHEFAEFFRQTKRGFVQGRRKPERPTVIRLHANEGEAADADDDGIEMRRAG